MAISFAVPLALTLLQLELYCAGATRSLADHELFEALEEPRVMLPQVSNIVLDVLRESKTPHINVTHVQNKTTHQHASAGQIQHEPILSQSNSTNVVTKHAEGTSSSPHGSMLQTHVRSSTRSWMRRLHSILQAREPVQIMGLVMPEWGWILFMVVTLSVCCCCFYRPDGKKYSRGLIGMISRERPCHPKKQYVKEGHVVYEWDQTSTTITMYAKPPKKVQKTVEVLVWPDSIYIGRKGKAPFLEEDIFAQIDPSSSSWSWTQEDELQIRLKKVVAAEWPRMILAHVDIDEPAGSFWQSTAPSAFRSSKDSDSFIRSPKFSSSEVR